MTKLKELILAPSARRMIRGAIAALVLSTSWACGSPSPGPVSAYTPPESNEVGDGWWGYVDPPTLDPASAAGVSPGTTTPEGAVVHFYASRLRGDDRYREVLIPDRPSKLDRNLEQLEEWDFRKVQLLQRKERSPGSLWIKVWFEIEIDGDVDSGRDEVGVREVDGRWFIESVPS